MNDAQIKALHASTHYGSFVFAGGGTALLAALLAVPGASGTVADARIPYASAALAQYLGGVPDQAVAVTTVRAMAMAALRQTLGLGLPEQSEPFGFAITASLRSATPKRGEHRAHIALQTLSETRTLSIVLSKDARSRAAEESLVSALGWTMLAELAGIPCPPVDLLAEENIARESYAGNPTWRRLIGGEVDALDFVTGTPPSAQKAARLVFPGSFNPLHSGHKRMAAVAEARTGLTVEYELCIANVDKAPLDYAAIGARGAGIIDERKLWLTRAGTFVAKARVFPGATFIVGIDTLVRIAEPRFYSSIEQRDQVANELAALGCHFLVFGRKLGDTFLNIDDVQLPTALRELCDAVPENAFRADLSSSQLRAAAKAQE